MQAKRVQPRTPVEDWGKVAGQVLVDQTKYEYNDGDATEFGHLKDQGMALPTSNYYSASTRAVVKK